MPSTVIETGDKMVTERPSPALRRQTLNKQPQQALSGEVNIIGGHTVKEMAKSR